MMIGVPIYAAVSSSGFNARSIANCRSWHRASLGITNVDGKASVWLDQSGVGDSNRDFTQVTEANRPTITAAPVGFNGRPALTFNGVDTYMITGTFSAAVTQPLTIYVVLRAAALGSLYAFDDVGGDSRVALLDSANTFDFYAGLELSGGTWSVDTTYVLALIANGASSTIYVNQFNTAAANGDANTNPLDSFTLGARFSLEGFFNGSIAELISYAGEHDASTRQIVMQALGSMYGVSVIA